MGPLTYIYMCPHTYTYILTHIYTCIYIRIHLHTYIHTNKHIYFTHIHIYKHTHTYAYVYIRTFTHPRIYIYTYIRICIYIYIYMYIYTYPYAYIYIYAHTYTAHPAWGDTPERCYKAQSSKLERPFSPKRGKRDVRALSLEPSKITPQMRPAVPNHIHTWIHTHLYIFTGKCTHAHMHTYKHIREA